MKSQLQFELYVAHSCDPRLPVLGLVRADVELDGERATVRFLEEGGVAAAEALRFSRIPERYLVPKRANCALTSVR